MGPPVDSIADELLSYIFNFFTLQELLLVVLVARRWRNLIIDHRTYWMDIDLFDFPETPAILASSRLFGLRLSCAASRPTNVTVQVHSANAAYALQHIAAHLSHIKRLNFTTALPLAADVLAALCNPAPMLESVVIYFTPGASECMPVPLPINLFDFNAPLLEYAFLSNMFFVHPLPPVLRRLTQLGIGGMDVHNPDVRFDIPDIFSACPDLRELLLCEDIALYPVFWEPEMWTRIERLSLSGGTIGRTWHHLQLPIRRVPWIRVDGGELSMLPILAGHLDGPLTLFGDAFTADNRFTLSLKSHTSAHERWLCADLPGPEDIPRETADDAMWTRVVRLVISVDHWDDYVPLFGALPALEDVVLVQLVQWMPLPGLLTAKLSCPHLKRLTIRNRLLDLVKVDIGSLEALATATLHGAPFPLELYLQNIDLEDSEDSEDHVTATFRTVVVDDIDAWC